MLAERLTQAKEMAAFQKMSAFFVHDLKNLASKISLTMQNLPVHYDNPEFRNDALRTMSQSLEKIKLMSSRLTSLSETLRVHPVETDLNQLVTEALATLDGSVTGRIEQHLNRLPSIAVDPEQIQKVITNLILNAIEAVSASGAISVMTAQNNGWIEMCIKDNGCGMSQEFIEKSLFQPFRSTKNKGMGIGLYHSKTIVEAHKGRIEVESEEGKGSVFRVMLPLKTG